jgi:hypothetical protein
LQFQQGSLQPNPGQEFAKARIGQQTLGSYPVFAESGLPGIANLGSFLGKPQP